MAAIDLQSFCLSDDGDFRDYLKTPFTQGEFTYATNGHMLVRVPKVDGIGPMKRDQPIDVEKVIVGLDNTDGFRPLSPTLAPPPVDGPKTIECTYCHGSGKEHECPDCDCECDACDGSGTVTVQPKVSTTLAGINIQLRYVHKLLTLPNVEIAPHSAEVAAEHCKPMFFRFDGGHGALMPLRERFAKHVDIEGAA